MSGRSGRVQSVDRAFAVLDALVARDGRATLHDLAVDTGLASATVHRLCATLAESGHVRRGVAREYLLGPRLQRLGDVAARTTEAWAQPVLAELVAGTGETANLAIREGDHVVYLAQVPSPHSMRMFTEVGRRAHTHNTGVGKAILATLPNEQVESIVTSAGMPTPTPKSLSTYADLVGDLDDIRQRSYSIDEEEQELGVRCFAVAIPDAPTEMAISVSGPTSRVDEDFAKRAVPLLLEAARGISADLIAAGNT